MMEKELFSNRCIWSTRVNNAFSNMGKSHKGGPAGRGGGHARERAAGAESSTEVAAEADAGAAAAAFLPFPLAMGSTLQSHVAPRLNPQTGMLEHFLYGEYVRENKPIGGPVVTGLLTWPQISKGVQEYFMIAGGGGTDEQKVAKFYEAAKR